jgi:arsenate reductase-like glutaredoxin family protein
VNANKVKIHREEALKLARAASSVWVTKGKKLIRFDPAADASDDEIAALILGRSGTLRAPAFRAGDTFMVGYSEEAYTDLFA